MVHSTNTRIRGRLLAAVATSCAVVAGPWVPSAAADVVVTYSSSVTSFNPFPDGFQDTMAFSLTLGPEATKVDVALVTGGVAVRSFAGVAPPAPGAPLPFTWDGHAVGGGLAPTGTYSVDVVVYDATNTPFAHTGVGTFTLVVETITGTVSAKLPAKGTLINNVSGKCGQLAKPSSHKWAGSIGYYSNARCKGRTRVDSAAEGVHAIALTGTVNGHKVTDYPSIRISAYGGAAKGHKHSRARLVYLLNTGFWNGRGAKLTPKVGWHAAKAAPGHNLLWEDNSLAWDIYTLGGDRYDVKGFRIDVTYQYLH